jgi:hypothetical protein
MTLPPPRTAAVQVGEFAAGAVGGYAVVAVAFAVSGTAIGAVVAAIIVVGVAAAIELRYGSKVTGLVAGLMPSSMLTAGVFTALSLVLYRIG